MAPALHFADGVRAPEIPICRGLAQRLPGRAVALAAWLAAAFCPLAADAGPAPRPSSAGAAAMSAADGAVPPPAEPGTEDRRRPGWSEDDRAFLEDGPGWLLAAEERAAFRAAPPSERAALRARVEADPMPATAANEMTEALTVRGALWRREFLSPADDRARALFLFGPPRERARIDCAETYRSVEIWTWTDAGTLLFYLPRGERGHVAWKPSDGKRPVYEDRMLGWLEQWEGLGSPGKRIELQLCPQATRVDAATGLAGLRRPVNGGAPGRRAPLEEPPADLADWVRAALAVEPATPGTPAAAAAVAAGGGEREIEPTLAEAAASGAGPSPDGPALGAARLEVLYPAARGQRIVARFVLGLSEPGRIGVTDLGGGPGGGAGAGAIPGSAPPDPADGAAPADEAAPRRRVHKLAVDGVIERQGRIFDTFRSRFELAAAPPGSPGAPLALVVERPLRPGDDAVLRLRVRDEVGGGEARFDRGLLVPRDPEPVANPPLPQAALAEMEQAIAARSLPGADAVTLIEPPDDVVLGLFRAEAIVSGERIRKLSFLVDGAVQFTRAAPPWSAELRMPKLPRETSIRVEGYDAAGALVAADDLVLNQPQGQLEIRLVEPRRRAGRLPAGTTSVAARAEVIVPEGRRVERVEFRLGEQTVAVRRQPPWSAEVPIHPLAELQYLTAVVVLDDGSRAEDLRFVNPPANFEEVDVQFVELYTSVVDRNGRPSLDLAENDFAVSEDRRPQKVVRFSRVDDLPLTLGLVLDVSGSMAASLGQAQDAAVGFLRNLVGPGDRCFALSFSDRPLVRMPRSDDPEAVAVALRDLKAEGSTALHDAIVHALYYFRGTRGQRALVLLSDGDDTSSVLPFRDAMEYARQSGVSIYSIGLALPFTAFEAKQKLEEIAQETGGRAFFVKEAHELASVYAEIERELRSQYLLAYVSDAPGSATGFRAVEVKVKKDGLRARTVRGYYP